MTISPLLSSLFIIMSSLFCNLARALRSPSVKLSSGSTFWVSKEVSTIGSEFVGVHVDFLLFSIWMVSV